MLDTMMAGDWLTQTFGEIVQSAREEVVERGWYGRVVTPHTQPTAPGAMDRSAEEPSPAERLGWSRPGERTQRDAEQGWFARNFAPDTSRGEDRAEPAARGHEQERGIER